MAFIYPEGISKDVIIEELDEDQLDYWHEKLHILWEQILSGTLIPDWTLRELYYVHKKILDLMKLYKIKHLFPINGLDLIKEI